MLQQHICRLLQMLATTRTATATATANSQEPTATLIGHQLCYRKISKQFVLCLPGSETGSHAPPLPSVPALVLLIDGGWCENSRCDLLELCNYFAYARLSKLNIQINSCLSFTVSHLIDFSVSPLLSPSLTLCVSLQLVPLGVCAINAMATRSQRMGHSMGSL